MKFEIKRQKRILRHKRVRAKILGTKERPRLSVFRSNRHLHLQLIDDVSQKTLAQASTFELPDKTKPEQRTDALAELFFGKAAKVGVGSVVFDRGGHQYHGSVKKLAESLRKKGLKI